MKISLLVPSYNEEKSLKKSLEAVFHQSRPLDEVIVVNDGSTDNSEFILHEFESKHANFHPLNLRENTGNKSKAQQKWLPHITWDIVIMTDADTVLDKDFVLNIEKSFEQDPEYNVAAVGGYVSSLKHNWITACWEIDYIIGQNIFKQAQSIIGYVYVMPGCATAIRTSLLRELKFTHDTVTEDLDFTFQIHLRWMKILYNTDAIVYTQDPPNLSSYIRQMKRWYGGGWQNIRKYWPIMFKNPAAWFVLTSIFIDGVIYSFITLVTPLIYPGLFFTHLLPLYFLWAFSFASYAAFVSKRYDLILYFPHYVFVIFINAYIIGYEFLREIIFRKRDLIWKRADRVTIK